MESLLNDPITVALLIEYESLVDTKSFDLKMDGFEVNFSDLDVWAWPLALENVKSQWNPLYYDDIKGIEITDEKLEKAKADIIKVHPWFK